MSRNPNSRIANVDKHKLLWIVKVGPLSCGFLVFGIERLFAIPEHSNLSYLIIAAVMGVAYVSFIHLLLKQPRWILTREAQQNLREQAKQRVVSPLSQANPFEPLSN